MNPGSGWVFLYDKTLNTMRYLAWHLFVYRATVRMEAFKKSNGWANMEKYIMLASPLHASHDKDLLTLRTSRHNHCAVSNQPATSAAEQWWRIETLVDVCTQDVEKFCSGSPPARMRKNRMLHCPTHSIPKLRAQRP
jgi:hypothetical protein